MKKKDIYKIVLLLCFAALFCSKSVNGQTANPSNIRTRAFVDDENVIKLRWAPTNPKAWVEGKNYGYTVEKHTIMIDNILLDTPHKQIVGTSFRPKPLNDWRNLIEKSDYAAVIAQALYGESFELTSATNDIGTIINQANELEQRFSTSLFVADFDFNAAEYAGWAWIDREAKANEKYLYRIYLNRPDTAIEGDTAVVFIGLQDKKELPQPIGLTAVSGDLSVLLSWNYFYQSDIYSAYHIERKSSEDTYFRRLTDIPVTILTSGMNEIFYSDSLESNEIDYTYRVVGVTGFDKEGPASDTVTRRGKKAIVCTPHILDGDFVSDQQARVFWEFDCEETAVFSNFQMVYSEVPYGTFYPLIDSISIQKKEFTFNLPLDKSYVKLLAVNNDGTKMESYPFLLQKIDSIPPAVPSDLNVVIDTLGVAHLTWTKNQEPDLRGYRILRSFAPDEEKTSISPDFIIDNEYRDSLSLSLGNPKVYYSLTALDIRYNESIPCETVVVDKPSLTTPDEPVFLDYEILDNEIKISWLTDMKRSDVCYYLLRNQLDAVNRMDTIYSGDMHTTVHIDKIVESGKYQYKMIARDFMGKESVSPQMLTIEIAVIEDLNTLTSVNSYVDRNNAYIELSWKKHEKANFYRIYRGEDNLPMELWKEVDSTLNRIVDESVSPGTKYTYMILFISKENRMSKPKTILINY